MYDDWINLRKEAFSFGKLTKLVRGYDDTTPSILVLAENDSKWNYRASRFVFRSGNRVNTEMDFAVKEIKTFDLLHGIIHFSVVVVIQASLNKKINALLYRHDPPLSCI